MPAAKHQSYATSRSRAKRRLRTGRIDQSSPAHPGIPRDDAPYARPRLASSAGPETAAATVASRSWFRAAGQFAEAAGEGLLAAASWIVTGMLDGCAAYALAMYGIPDAISDENCADAKLAEATAPPTRILLRPALQVVSRDRARDLPAATIPSALDTAQACADAASAAAPGQPSAARSSWRATTIALALLSGFRTARARHQAIAELNRLDDGAPGNMGISRADIGYIARHGVGPQ